MRLLIFIIFILSCSGDSNSKGGFFTIVTTADNNGKITSTKKVSKSSDVIIEIIPNKSYVVDVLMVDNIEVAPAYQYTFKGVNSNHEISVTFKLSNLATIGYMNGKIDGPLVGVISVAHGKSFSIALKKDGSVVGWGSKKYGQSLVPEGLSDVVAIAAGYDHALALKKDGTIVGWGNNDSGQINTPENLSDVQAISAGYRHSVALKKDGTVEEWGLDFNDYFSTATDLIEELHLLKQKPDNFGDVIAISSGEYHIMALKSNGSVVSWGLNDDGQADGLENLSGIKAIAAGMYHSVALKFDGTIISWGKNKNGQTDIPLGLNNVISIAAGDAHTIVLKQDGSVIGWGGNFWGQLEIPRYLPSVSSISAGIGTTSFIFNEE